MIIGVLGETHPDERRVALVPASVGPLVKAGCEILVESGAGAKAGFLDADYEAKGARVADRAAVLGEAGRANVQAIHGRGLGVIAWTFRDDSVSEGYADSAAEAREAIDNGIDGFFTDFPDTGMQVRNQWLEAQPASPDKAEAAPRD